MTTICAKCRKVIVKRKVFPRRAGIFPQREEIKQVIAVRNRGICVCKESI